MTNEQKKDLKWMLLYFLMQTSLRLIILAALISAFFIDGWGILLFFIALLSYFPVVVFLCRKYPELADWWLTFHD